MSPPPLLDLSFHAAASSSTATASLTPSSPSLFPHPIVRSSSGARRGDGGCRFAQRRRTREVWWPPIFHPAMVADDCARSDDRHTPPRRRPHSDPVGFLTAGSVVGHGLLFAIAAFMVSSPLASGSEGLGLLSLDRQRRRRVSASSISTPKKNESKTKTLSVFPRGPASLHDWSSALPRVRSSPPHVHLYSYGGNLPPSLHRIATSPPPSTTHHVPRLASHPRTPSPAVEPPPPLPALPPFPPPLCIQSVAFALLHRSRRTT
jgi:hypothetical protein